MVFFFLTKHPQSYPTILQNHSYTIPWLDISNGQMLGSWCADTVCLHAYQLFRSCFALHHLSISIWCLLSHSLDLSSGSGDCLLIFFPSANSAASTGGSGPWPPFARYCVKLIIQSACQWTICSAWSKYGTEGAHGLHIPFESVTSSNTLLLLLPISLLMDKKMKREKVNRVN